MSALQKNLRCAQLRDSSPHPCLVWLRFFSDANCCRIPALSMKIPAQFRLCSVIVFLSVSVALPACAQNEYELGPESTERAPGVPKGRVEKFQFTESKVFPDTTRDCWIYIPAQYDGSKPAALMVFQDGSGYVSETGGQRVPIVFDNLIVKGEMPVTIGIFINPGNRNSANSSAAGAN